jgi:N-acetyl-anhydromuramyl-L-alanine amidase AmpD
VVRRDGTLEPGRDEAMQGAHAIKANHRSIGICLAGGSDANGKWKNNFTPEQFTSLKALILNLQNKYTIQHIIGHNEIEKRKECPSFNVHEWLEQEKIDVV